MKLRYSINLINFFQSNRTLSWKPHLGVVTLEIELKDRTLNLTVSPVHATIIWHFQTKSKNSEWLTSWSEFRFKMNFIFVSQLQVSGT